MPNYDFPHSYPDNRDNTRFHTKNTTSDGEPKPTSDKLSKKGGVESGEKQPQRRGKY